MSFLARGAGGDAWGLPRGEEKNISGSGVRGAPARAPSDAPTMPLPPKKFASRLYMCMLPPMPLLAPSTLPISSAMTSRGVPPRPRCVQ